MQGFPVQTSGRIVILGSTVRILDHMPGKDRTPSAVRKAVSLKSSAGRTRARGLEAGLDRGFESDDFRIQFSAKYDFKLSLGGK
jgi:hypothetical protein